MSAEVSIGRALRLMALARGFIVRWSCILLHCPPIGKHGRFLQSHLTFFDVFKKLSNTGLVGMTPARGDWAKRMFNAVDKVNGYNILRAGCIGCETEGKGFHVVPLLDKGG